MTSRLARGMGGRPEAMVREDRNHRSVIMYSIGDEIPEVAKPHGAVRSRRLAERVRAPDPSRYVTVPATAAGCGPAWVEVVAR